jgi:glycosyltransferase involved in cell wall biosynthesis
MKIVINAFSARVGGGKTYLANLLANLPDDPALDIHLFAHEDLAVPNDSRVRRIAVRWPVANPLVRTIWEKLVLPAYLRNERVALLFCPGGVIATRPPPGCRTVTMFRNMLPFDPVAAKSLGWTLQRVRNAILRRVLMGSMVSADLTIFISEHARRLVERLATVPNPVTIPHGVAPAFRTFGRPLPRPDEAGPSPYILYVSRFEPYKHHREVIEAFVTLPEDVRGGRRLLLAGEADSPSAAEARALIAKCGAGNRVILLGGVPYHRLPALYAHADLILFASSCENCPNILLEALGAGRPLLSSDIMPMPEFGGSDIGYFTPSDPADIARAMAVALADREHAAALAQASAERSLRYDWHETAARTWRALAETAAGRMAA